MGAVQQKVMEKAMRLAEKKAKQGEDKLGQMAVEWLKNQAVERASSYKNDRYYNCGDIVRALGLGSSWSSREKAYPMVMGSLKRAEELGFVEVDHRRSPIGFRYVGPEVLAAQEAAEKALTKQKLDAQRLINKTRIKDIWLESRRYGDGDIRVEMTFEAFQKLAKKAGL